MGEKDRQALIKQYPACRRKCACYHNQSPIKWQRRTQVQRLQKPIFLQEELVLEFTSRRPQYSVLQLCTKRILPLTPVSLCHSAFLLCACVYNPAYTDGRARTHHQNCEMLALQSSHRSHGCFRAYRYFMQVSSWTVEDIPPRL
jgi:hypothetical protein